MGINTYSGLEVFVTVGGKVFLPQDLGLFEMDVIDIDEGDNEVDLHCNDNFFKIADSVLFSVGNLLSIQWGYTATSNMSQQRSGYVIMKSSTEYDKGGIVSIIHAKTLSSVLAGRRPQKNYGPNITLGSIVTDIANRSGLTLNLTGGSEILSGFSQGNWSDRQCLRVLADRLGYQASFSSTTLTFAPRSFSDTPGLSLVFGKGEDSTIIRASVKVNVHAQLGAATNVQITSLDPNLKTVSCHQATPPVQELAVYAGDGSTSIVTQNPDSKPPVPKSPVGTLLSSVLPWQPNAGSTTQSPTGGNIGVPPPDVLMAMSSPEASDVNALLHATSLNQRQQKKQADLEVDTVGQPLAHARMIVDVQGLSKRDSGLYYVTKVHHKIVVKSTYICVFDLNRHGNNAGGPKVKAPVNMQSCHGSQASTTPKKVVVSADTGQTY